MSRTTNGQDPERTLDRALEEIAAARPSAAEEQAAAARVWARIGREMEAPAAESDDRPIRSCSDFQARIPAYLGGELSHGKRLLLADHFNECVPCRRALNRARSAQPAAATGVARTRPGWVATWALRAAAAAVVFVAFWGLSFKTDLFTIEAGGLIRIETVEGEVLQITNDGTRPVRGGEEITFADVTALRTGKSGRAVLRLADDSLVEVSERAQLAVHDRRPFWSRGDGDAVIDLARGSIIVEASEQGSGHLYVDTDDCRVAVTGTVFSVNHGAKGSRVSVIEGEVRVQQSGDLTVLLPGGQTTTSADIEKVPVAEEIAWSRNLDRHLALLGELAELTAELDRRVGVPALRYRTTLLDAAPARTVIYVGVPNLTEVVGQGYDLLRERIDGNDLLRTWWAESMAGSEAEADLERAMSRVRRYGGRLGDEIAIALPALEDASGADVGGPVLTAEVDSAEAFLAEARADLEQVAASGDGHSPIALLGGAAPAPIDDFAVRERPELYLWAHAGFVALSPEPELVAEAAAALQGAGSPFVGSPFHRSLAGLYDEGAGLVLGFDIGTLIEGESAGQREDDRALLERTGLLDLQHVIAERQEKGDKTENRVVVTFDRPRQGLAAWLAEPAPNGALDFVSADAQIAAAFVMREPATVVDELLAFLADSSEDFESRLAEFEREHGIDVRRDIAATLGGEFAFALDGPVLPNPSWKLIVEVYDPARLETTLEWAVARLNEVAGEHDAQGFAIESTELGGRTYHSLRSLDTGLAAHYLFVDGYLVAGASRALIDRALEYRAAGATLAASPRFRSLLPADGHVNFSGVGYHNLGDLLGPVTSLVQRSPGQLTPEQQRMLEHLGATAKPSLTVAYGERQSVVFVNTTEGGFFGSAVGSFLRLDGLFRVQELIGQAARQGAAG